MLSLVTIFPVITAFHSCLSHHIFDQENLWPSWVGIETAIFWPCLPETVETQCLYLLRFKKARGEIWSKRSEKKQQKKPTQMRTKSPQWIKKINSQMKKPHLKRIPNKVNLFCLKKIKYLTLLRKFHEKHSSSTTQEWKIKKKI